MTSYRGILSSFNLQFYFTLLRLILPAASVTNQNLLILVAFIFLVLYVYFSWYQPALFYKYNTLKQTMMSAIAYTCICKLYKRIDPMSSENLFLWTLGIISFSFMASAHRSYRMRQILV